MLELHLFVLSSKDCFSSQMVWEAILQMFHKVLTARVIGIIFLFDFSGRPPSSTLAIT